MGRERSGWSALEDLSVALRRDGAGDISGFNTSAGRPGNSGAAAAPWCFFEAKTSAGKVIP
jgi:hypothetical protein